MVTSLETMEPPENDLDPTAGDPDVENRSGGVNIEGDAEIHGDVVGRDKITTVSVNKNVIQIGTLVMPTVPVAIAATLVALVAILAGLRLLGLTDAPGPARMPGGFNVAIAEFGKVDANGQIAASEDGQRLSRAVFDTLQAQVAEFEDKAIGSRIVVWHDSLPRTQKGATLGVLADEAAAAELAGRVDANIVVYGNLDAHNGFIPRFYVSPNVRSEIDPLLTGDHRLGTRPIEVDPADRLIAETELATRASALTYLTIGLTYDALGRSELALNTYREAEAKLTAWPERGAGKEVLYLFAGQAALFASQQARPEDVPALDQEADRAFRNAIGVNPQYAKGHIGLGSVYFLRAQRTQPAQSILDGADLGNAFTEYTLALDLAGQASETDVAAIAMFALGTAHYLEGIAYRDADQLGRAQVAFDESIRRINAALNTLRQSNQRRLLGQAYHALGLAYQQQAEIQVEQGNTEQSRSRYRDALAAFQQCIDLGQGDPDEILREMVVNRRCAPSLDKVNDALGQLGGE
jgi:tetratricopeptide (TPR) repeat protein